MFRRPLKYRADTESLVQPQNSHFPTTRIPPSATMNSSSSFPLGDATNTKSQLNIRNALRMAVNPYKMINGNVNDEFRPVGFENHCDR